MLFSWGGGRCAVWRLSLVFGIVASLQLASLDLKLAADAYTIQEIPTLGGDESSALGINDLGHVVGFAKLGDGESRAIRWIGGTITDLGTTGNFSIAYDINDTGRIVGQSTTGSFPNTGFAFYLDAGDTTPTPLANLPNTNNAVARTVNGSGQIAGGSLTADEVDAVIWDGLGAIRKLPAFLAEPAAQGDVWDSNDSNDLVGWSMFVDVGTGFIGRRAALWPGGGTQGEIVPLETLGGNGSEARGVNNQGQIVGMAALTAGTAHAFLWADGAVKDLGDLGSGETAVFSLALDVNDAGQVVGLSQVAPSSSFEAFLWEDGVMRNLNDLIPAGSGWTLTQAEAINNGGQIVGQGISPTGQKRGFVLSPAGPDHGSPGRVPNGDQVPGVPLTLRKDQDNPDVLVLEWGASCRLDATDYAVYCGDLALFDSHIPVTCSTGGSLTWSFSAQPGNVYYLVVPQVPGVEGSYGRASSETERPRSIDACADLQSVQDCP